MRWEIIVLALFLVGSVSAATSNLDQVSIAVAPIVNGTLQPLTALSYQFDFTSNSDCTGVLLSKTATITTDLYGRGSTELNTSAMTTVPAYLCEYLGGSLKKVHTLNQNVFQGGGANNTMWNDTGSAIVLAEPTRNVGIGNSTPTHPLTVQDGARFQGSSGLWTTGNFKKTLEFSKDSGILWNGDGLSNTFGLVQGGNDLTLSFASDDTASSTRNVVWTARSALGRLDVDQLLYLTANSYAIKASADTYYLIGRSTSGNQFGSLRYDNANDYVALGMNFDDSLTVHVDKQVGINDITPDAELDIAITDSTDVGLIVQGASSQSANLQEWQNSSGSNMVELDPAGNIGIGINPTYELDIDRGTGQAVIRATGDAATLILKSTTTDSGSRPGIQCLNNRICNFQGDDHADQEFDFFSKLVATRVYDTKMKMYGHEAGGYNNWSSFESEGADFIINSNLGDVIFKTGSTAAMTIDSSQKVGVGIDTTPDAQLAVDSQVSTNIGLIVQGAASQSANLQEWQNSAGTVLSKVDSGGSFDTNVTYKYNGVQAYKDVTEGMFVGQAGGQIGASAGGGASGNLLFGTQNVGGEVGKNANQSVTANIVIGTANAAYRMGQYKYQVTNNLIVGPGAGYQAAQAVGNPGGDMRFNQFMGYYAGYQYAKATSGAVENNIAFGTAALRDADITQTGQPSGANVAIGSNAGYNAQSITSSGSLVGNALIGYNSGYRLGYNASGQAQYNTFIGPQAGQDFGYSASGHVQRNVLIGYLAGQGWTDGGNDLLAISNSNRRDTLVFGDFANEYLNVNYNLGVGLNQTAPTATITVMNDGSKNLTEWQNSAGNALAYVTASGDMVVADQLISKTALYLDSTGTTDVLVRPNGVTRMTIKGDDGSGRVGVGTIPAGSGQLHVTSLSATRSGLTVQGATSQTANLQEWQNSSGGVLASVNASGRVISHNGGQNVSLKRPAFGEMYINDVGNTQATTITSSSNLTFVEGNTSWDSSKNWCFDMVANNTLQYTCKDTISGHAGATLTVSSVGANDVMQAAIFENGVEIIGSRVEETLAGAGVTASTAIHVFVTLDQYDNLSLYVANENDADDLTVKYMNLFAVGMSAGQDS